MIRIAEQLGFMKVRALEVCTKAEIGRRARHIKSCSRANFQQSGNRANGKSQFKDHVTALCEATGEDLVPWLKDLGTTIE